MSNLTADEPVRFVVDCLDRGAVLWTYHVNMRLSQRGLTRAELLGGQTSLRLLEWYPDDRSLPSGLFAFQARAGEVHVVLALDFPNRNIRVVTAYYPSPDKWTGDGVRRR